MRWTKRGSGSSPGGLCIGLRGDGSQRMVTSRGIEPRSLGLQPSAMTTLARWSQAGPDGNEPAVGRGGGNRTRISRLMGPPRSPSLPSATRSWRARRIERRGHSGGDSGTRTRTPALTTRRLSLRLCPPQNGPGGRAHIPCVSGPSGWTRTTTSRVKSPACCVDTTKGIEHWSEWRDSNPHLKAWKARRRPLPHIRIWFGLRVSNPFLRAGNAGCIPPHPGRTWTGVVHRPIDIRQLSKTPLDASDRVQRQSFPSTWRARSFARQAKTKRPSRGSP